jgi:hypothetical protein
LAREREDDALLGLVEDARRGDHTRCDIASIGPWMQRHLHHVVARHDVGALHRRMHTALNRIAMVGDDDVGRRRRGFEKGGQGEQGKGEARKHLVWTTAIA